MNETQFETMTVRVNLGFIDIARALFFQQLDRWYGKILAGLLPLLFIWALVQGLTADRWNWVALVVPVALPLALVLFAWTSYRRLGEAQKQLLYTLESEGIEVSDGNRRSILYWRDVRSVLETPFDFLILAGSSLFLLIPKKSFAGDETSRFRAVLRSYITDPARLKGFAS